MNKKGITMSTWTEHRDGMIVDAGDFGGDVQDGPAVSRRWQRQAGQLWHIFTVAYYPAKTEPYSNEPIRKWLEEQREYIVCKDPHDPGGTELWADYRYAEQPNADPEQKCREFIEQNIDFDDVIPKWVGA